MKYISDFYKSEAKIWTDKDGNFTDLGKFKAFIESMGYVIKDKIPSNCRCEGTSVSISEFKKIFAEEDDKWLKENYGCEVIAVAGDVGQKDELEGLEAKALATGASKYYVADCKEEFVHDLLRRWQSLAVHAGPA